MPLAWIAERLNMGREGIWRGCCSDVARANRLSPPTNACSQYDNLIKSFTASAAAAKQSLPTGHNINMRFPPATADFRAYSKSVTDLTSL